MQRAQGPEDAASPDAGSSRPRFVLLPVIAVVALVLAAGLAVYILSRPESDTAQEPNFGPPADSFSLTNEEAIERLQELNAVRIRAYETRDLSLVRYYLTSDSPLIRKTVNEITELKKDGVVPNLHLRTVRASVIENSSEEIKLEQVAIFDVDFRDESGRDLTIGGGEERQEIEWTLHRESGRWLAFNSLVTKAKPVRNAVDS